MKFRWCLLLWVVPVAVLAQHEAHNVNPHEIPWSTIGVQTFNFLALIGFLIYALGKTVAAHFQERARLYIELVERAENARKEAERSHHDIASKLKALQDSAAQSVKQAQVEAETMKRKMIEDASSLAKKMEEDAERSARLEIEKAKNELRLELLRASIEASRESLKKIVNPSEQKRLQSEFVEKIQVVGQ